MYAQSEQYEKYTNKYEKYYRNVLKNNNLVAY